MQYNKKSVEDIDVSGKKVIARCDFNVPQDENGNITDDKRIRASLETIKYLLDHNAAVILSLIHIFGRALRGHERPALRQVLYLGAGQRSAGQGGHEGPEIRRGLAAARGRAQGAAALCARARVRAG